MAKKHTSGKKPTAQKAEDPQAAIGDDFDEPIVVPFRGMGDLKPGNYGESDLIKGLSQDVGERQVLKMYRLAERYGVDLNGPDGWQELCVIVLSKHHPGFKVVYDDWHAREFHRLHGFTPIYELKSRPPPKIAADEKSWRKLSKLYSPETLAVMADLFNRRSVTDGELCTLIVEAGDPQMSRPQNRSEKERRIATLIRKLSEGRKRLLKQQDTTGGKSGV